MDFGAECSARSICFDLSLPHLQFSASSEAVEFHFHGKLWCEGGGGGGRGTFIITESNDESVLIFFFKCWQVWKSYLFGKISLA